MALVGPSNGQLLLRLLSGLSHFLSSCLFSSSHTSRGIAKFHVSDFRHDDDYFLGFFLSSAANREDPPFISLNWEE